MAKVSTNFTVYEVGRSDIATRLEIPNKPPQWVLENAALVATHILEPVREHFGKGYLPNSWYRSEEFEQILTWEKGFRRWCARHNKNWITKAELYKRPKALDSWTEYFDRKQHPTGKAVDIEIAGVDNDTLFFWIRDNLGFDQLIREFPNPGDPASGWVHVSWSCVQTNRQSYFSYPSYDKYV